MSCIYSFHASSPAVSDTLYHIATVGDDNALAVLSLTVAEASASAAHLEVLWSEPSAHSSSITGQQPLAMSGNAMPGMLTPTQRLTHLISLKRMA